MWPQCGLHKTFKHDQEVMTKHSDDQEVQLEETLVRLLPDYRP